MSSDLTKKKFLFDAHKSPASRFEMPGDGRKAKHKAHFRRSLLLEYGSFADKFGRGACPSAKTLAARLGCSEKTVDRYTADLKQLGFVQNRGKSRFRGTMVRDLDLPPIGSDSQPSIPPDSTPTGSDSPPIGSANDPAMGSANDPLSAFDLPTNIPAHQPPEEKAEEGGKNYQNRQTAANEEKSIKWTGGIFDWMQREFYRVTENVLVLSAKSRDSLATILQDESQNAVKIAFSRLLDRERGWNGLSDPSSVIVGELPAYLQIACIDREEETKRAQLDAVTKAAIERDRKIAWKRNDEESARFAAEEAEIAKSHETPNLMGT